MRSKMFYGVFLVWVLISFFLFIGVHEGAHMQINQFYGCEDNEIRFLTGSGLASVHGSCSFESEELEASYMQSQSNVESLGYQLGLGYVLLLVLTYFVVAPNGGLKK